MSLKQKIPYLWEATISFIIFWDFSMFYQIFLSPQVKQCAIITNKHGIYELPHKLPNDLRLRKLGNIRKLSKLHRTIAQCSVHLPKWKFCWRKLLKNRNLTLTVVHYFTWKLELVSDVLWVIVEKRKLIVDIIYRLIHFYQNYFFVSYYLNANYCFYSLENKIDK